MLYFGRVEIEEKYIERVIYQSTERVLSVVIKGYPVLFVTDVSPQEARSVEEDTSGRIRLVEA